MSKSLLSKEQIDVGYQRFFEENPRAKAKVDEVTQEIADILGVELSQLRRDEAFKLLCEQAAELGIEEFEYLLQFAVDTDDERLQILQTRQDEISRALGLSN